MCEQDADNENMTVGEFIEHLKSINSSDKPMFYVCPYTEEQAPVWDFLYKHFDDRIEFSPASISFGNVEVLTDDEFRLIKAYRNNDNALREAALKMLAKD